MPPIKRFDHIGSTVADLDASTIISAAMDLWVIPPGRSMV